MEYHISNLARRLYFIYSFSGIILTPILLFLAMHLGLFNSAIIFTIGLMVGLVCSIVLARILANRELEIFLTDEFIEIGSYKIKITDIIGYHLTDDGIIGKLFEFKDKVRKYQITSISKGERAIEFDNFLESFKRKIHESNENLELDYHSFHPKLSTFHKWSMPIIGVILFLLNLVFFYFVITGKLKFNYKIFIVDFSFLGLFSALRNEKKN